jgi:hypothetical protein
MDSKKFVDTNLKEHFPNWARIQIAELMDNWARKVSIQFVQHLGEKGFLNGEEIKKPTSIQTMYRKFEKIKAD